MSIKRMPISLFVNELEAAWKRKDGYIMGAKGQDPKKWSTSSWWFTQYTGKQRTKALYWREKASRVWDCNGLAEGIYEDYTGVNINTYARTNYSNWCGAKGSGKIPKNRRVPGAAVFIYSSSSGYITHVGYLYQPVKKSDPTGDWYVIEARGVMYGVVRTKLSERSWNRWGLMTKYFDYSGSANIEPAKRRDLKNGCEGADVKQLQESLIRLGYNLGKWGADGDFGDATEEAVRAFQKAEGIKIDGVVGEETFDAIENALAKFNATVENPRKVTIVGGNCYVRTAPNTSGTKLGVAYEGEKYSYGGETSNGWYLIDYKNQNGWVSGKYSKLVDK